MKSFEAGSNAVTPEGLIKLLTKTLKHGARAVELHLHVPELVDILCPPDTNALLSPIERAIEAEKSIRKALDGLGESFGEALLRLLALAPGYADRSLYDRQNSAGNVLGGLDAGTVRRPYWRRRLFGNLAVELYKALLDG